jgi:hypothetical protein
MAPHDPLSLSQGADLDDEGTKNKDLDKWTGGLVLHCLEEAFRRKPDAAMFSMSTVSDLPSDCPIEGTDLIQATTLALGFDSHARIHILHHARSSANGELTNKRVRCKISPKPNVSSWHDPESRDSTS